MVISAFNIADYNVCKYAYFPNICKVNCDLVSPSLVINPATTPPYGDVFWSANKSLDIFTNRPSSIIAFIGVSRAAHVFHSAMYSCMDRELHINRVCYE